MSEASPSYRTLLRQRAFVRLWFGQTSSQVGDAIARVTVPVLAVSLTHHNAILGLIFAAQALPWLVMAPFAGLLADRVDRRRLLRLTLLGEATVIAMMAFAGSGAQLLLLTFLAGCMQVMQTSARSSALPGMLGSHLALGIGVTAATVQIVDIAGQAAGGLLLVEFTARALLIADAATFVIFAITVPSLPNASGAVSTEPFRRRISAGLRFVWRSPAIHHHVLIMLARGVTVTAGLSLLYALAVGREAGPAGFGLISAAFTAALVIGSLATGPLTNRHDPTTVTLVTTMAAGLCLIPMWLPLSLAATAGVLIVTGLLYAPGNVIANTEISRLTPDNLRAQVIMAAWAAIKAGQVLGGLATAWLVTRIDAGPTIAVVGTALAGTAGWSLLMGFRPVATPNAPD